MNSARGENVITLGKTKLTLALEYKRIVELEDATGIGIIAHAGRFTHLVNDPGIMGLASSPVTLQQIVMCLHILTGGKQYSEEMLGKLVLHEGVVGAATELALFFNGAVTGNPLEESEADREAGQ